MSLSNFRQRLQSRISTVCSRILKRYGDTVTYTHRSGTPITNLVASPGKEEKRLNYALKAEVEETTRVFWIPRQTNFPPTSLSIGDSITYQSIVYIVERYSDNDDIGAYYKFETVRTQATRLGAV